jgi:hypothetical protein
MNLLIPAAHNCFPKLLPWYIHTWWMNTTLPMLTSLAVIETYRETLDAYWRPPHSRPNLHVVK